MESDLLCFIPEYLCSGFAEHISKGIGCCAIILFAKIPEENPKHPAGCQQRKRWAGSIPA